MLPVRSPRYPKEEFARRGIELYERCVRSQVEPQHCGRIVALDIDSGEYEIADDTLNASRQLLARRPEAQIWVVRVGHRTVHRYGFRPPVPAP